MDYLETAFAQLAFSWKLLAYIEDEKLDLAELDQPMTYRDNGMVLVLPDQIFDSYDDLVLACQNLTSMAFGAAAIALNRAREESGLQLPNPIITDRDKVVSLAYQIRNAFAHDIAEPRWNIHDGRYAIIYQFNGIRVDLTQIEYNTPFRYEHIGGPDTLFAMKAYLEIVGREAP